MNKHSAGLDNRESHALKKDPLLITTPKAPVSHKEPLLFHRH